MLGATLMILLNDIKGSLITSIAKVGSNLQHNFKLVKNIKSEHGIVIDDKMTEWFIVKDDKLTTWAVRQIRIPQKSPRSLGTSMWTS